MKKVNLFDISKLHDNKAISEIYVRYLADFPDEKQYRHEEIKYINELLKILNIETEEVEDFYYGYEVPQLNKEFDLLKVTKESVLNIELKGTVDDELKILEQLKKNLHYLKLLNRKCYQFTYLSKEQKLFKLNKNKLEVIDFDELYEVIKSISQEDIDEVYLDEYYKPNVILVSPLNNPKRFISNSYLLTENQENIKKEIINDLEINNKKYYAIHGNAGTGKTLLLYDIGKTLSENKNILLIHSGIICKGHSFLNKNMEKFKIISAKDLKYKDLRNVDVLLVDEAHRLYREDLEKIIKWVNKKVYSCIFSFDGKQVLSYSEERRQTTENIKFICKGRLHKLTNKIRTNKEISLFVQCLFDLSKYRDEYKFANVKIVYEPDKLKAVERAKNALGYTYISYTGSFYNHDIDYQFSQHNTHNVIGQEFDRVCMIMGNEFYYKNNKLKGYTHPTPDYIYTQLLYQGLTRAQTGVLLIITDIELLKSILNLI